MIFYILLFFVTTIKTKVSFSDGLNYANQSVAIAENIIILSTPEIDIDKYLSEQEIDKRYEIMLSNFLDRYSTKNKKYKEIDMPAYQHKHRENLLVVLEDVIGDVLDSTHIKAFHDTYEKIREAAKHYNIIIQNGKDKINTRDFNVKGKGKEIYIDKIDNVIIACNEMLSIIYSKREVAEIEIELEKVKKYFLGLLFDYQEEIFFLSEIINKLGISEQEIGDITNLEEDNFNNFLNKNFNSDNLKYNELYGLFDSLCTSEILLVYKNNLYINKKQKLNTILKKINILYDSINKMLNEKNKLLLKNNLINDKYTFGKIKDQETRKMMLILSSALDNKGVSFEGDNSNLDPVAKLIDSGVGVLADGIVKGFKGTKNGFENVKSVTKNSFENVKSVTKNGFEKVKNWFKR